MGDWTIPKKVHILFKTRPYYEPQACRVLRLGQSSSKFFRITSILLSLSFDNFAQLIDVGFAWWHLDGFCLAEFLVFLTSGVLMCQPRNMTSRLRLIWYSCLFGLAVYFPDIL